MTRNTAPSSATSSSRTRTDARMVHGVRHVALAEEARAEGLAAEISGWSILIATRWPLRWTPLYTAAMPPTPMRVSSLYFPQRVRPTRCPAYAASSFIEARPQGETPVYLRVSRCLRTVKPRAAPW